LTFHIKSNIQFVLASYNSVGAGDANASPGKILGQSWLNLGKFG